jgi:hypothetical protein
LERFGNADGDVVLFHRRSRESGSGGEVYRTFLELLEIRGKLDSNGNCATVWRLFHFALS